MRHARKLLPIAALVALTLLCAAPAVAHRAVTTPAGQTSQTFSCLGKVTAVDQQDTPNTITLTVKRACTALQGSLGQPLTLTVGVQSSFTVVSHHERASGTLADVAVGDCIAARGTIDASNPDALAYDLSGAWVWQPAVSAHFLCRGTVSSVVLQTNADALVVTVGRGSRHLGAARGDQLTIAVPAAAKLFLLQGRGHTATTFDQITQGDRVRVSGTVDRSDPSAPVYTAGCVLVRHVVAADQLTWFACCGTVASNNGDGALTVDVLHGSRGVRGAIGSTLTLTTTDSSVIRTLADGVLSTIAVASVQADQAIVVTGTIDRSGASPVYDIGQAFVWSPAAS